MADPEGRGKSAVTPRQMLLVGVLGVILAIVLIVQFGGAKADNRKTPPAPSAPAKHTRIGLAETDLRVSERRGHVGRGSKPAATAWPKFTAETAAEYDPFAVGQAMREQLAASRKVALARKPVRSLPKRDAGAAKMAALKKKGITLIVRGQHGASAMIGDRVVRVGDVVEGYRVVSIDPQGVVLAPADRRDSHEAHK